MALVEDDKELVMGIEKVAEFSSQLSKVLMSLGQGFKTLQSSCNKTEESVIDIKESLKKTRSRMEVMALQAKTNGAGVRRESLISTAPLPTGALPTSALPTSALPTSALPTSTSPGKC